MAARKKTAPPSRTKPTLDATALMASLGHPHEEAITMLRDLIRSADRRVVESVKWNAPTFALGDQDFATFHLRAKKGVQLILHFGAKRRSNVPPRGAIEDPQGLLTWLGDDRATLQWPDLGAVKTTRGPTLTLLKSWIAALPDRTSEND